MADPAADVNRRLSRAVDDCDRVGSWVLSRFCTVRSNRNASWASFSGSTSTLEIGRVWVRFGERRHVKSRKVLYELAGEGGAQSSSSSGVAVPELVEGCDCSCCCCW